MFNTTPSNSNFLDLLNNPNTTLDQIVSSKDFFHYWTKSERKLESFIIKHCDELIEIGFQIEGECLNSIRCLQIMSSQNITFHHHLFTQTNFLQFVHDFLFNISFHPFYSQKNYFFVLPNIIIDKKDTIYPIFDQEYFKELFSHMENDYAFNFILRLIEFGPYSLSKIFDQIEIDKTIIQNLLTYNSIENNNPQSNLILYRSIVLFKTLVDSKFEGELSACTSRNLSRLIKSAFKNPNSECFSFLSYLDEISTSKTSISKWHKIHLKIIPHLSSFCDIVLNSDSQSFTPLLESCTLLSLSIVSTTKDVPECFVNLFKHLLSLFFTLKTNTFLHNCFERCFRLLVSIGKINSSFLDELDLFNKITDIYEYPEKDYYYSFWGQLRLISEEMNQFVPGSKTVKVDEWNKYVVKKNHKSDQILKEKFGGLVPPDINEIKRFISRRKYYNPSFFSKNLLNENKQPKKVKIYNPLY